MPIRAFRFNSRLFNTRLFDSDRLSAHLRSAFAPRKPRHRVLRVLLGLVGVGLLVALVMAGVVVGAAMLTVGLLYRLWRGRGKPLARDPRVVDADFRVVDKLGVVDKLALPSR